MGMMRKLSLSVYRHTPFTVPTQKRFFESRSRWVIWLSGSPSESSGAEVLVVVVHVVLVQSAERAYPDMALRVFGYGGDFLVGEVVGYDGAFDFGIPVFG